MSDEQQRDQAAHPPGGEKRRRYALSARDLVASVHQGVLSTLCDEYPYGSVVELLPTDNGDLVLYLSRLAVHTRNIEADPRASILVTEPSATDAPLSLKRATLLGAMTRIEGKPDDLKRAYVAAHPHAEDYIGFADFAFYRLVVERVRYIGGFGEMGWSSGELYHGVKPTTGLPGPHETAALK